MRHGRTNLVEAQVLHLAQHDGVDESPRALLVVQRAHHHEEVVLVRRVQVVRHVRQYEREVEILPVAHRHGRLELVKT